MKIHKIAYYEASLRGLTKMILLHSVSAATHRLLYEKIYSYLRQVWMKAKVVSRYLDRNYHS